MADWKQLIGEAKPLRIKCPKCGARMAVPTGNLCELGMVLVACLIPTFLLAAEVDGDEFAKATSGAVLAGVLLAGYRVYKGATNHNESCIIGLPDEDEAQP